MECGAGDGGAADEDGLELGDGGDLARASSLEGDAEKLRDACAGGELVGDGPAGSFAGEADAALLCGGVGLDDDAVDLVAESVAEGFGVSDEGEDGVYVVYGAGVLVDGGSRRCAVLRGSRMWDGSEGAAPSRREEVGVEVEASLGDDVRFEGADGAGGGVARVDCGCEALGFALLVHLEEGGLREDDLAAHLKGLGQAGGFEVGDGDAQRDGADGADVAGDVFADGAVAAGDAAGQMRRTFWAGFVLQRQGESVPRLSSSQT